MLKHSSKFFALKNYINQIVSLSDEEFADVNRYFKPLDIPAGAYISEEGLVCNQIIFVVKGYLRSYYEIKEEEVTNYIVSRHTVLTAFASFTSREPSKEYIQALTDCELLSIHYDHMQMLYKKYTKWQELGRLIMEQIYHHTEARVFSFLTQSAEERYLSLLREQPRLIKDVPLRYIASMLGITPETLSRIRNKVSSGALAERE